MPSDMALRRRRYRGFVIVFSVIFGIALGVGLGSLAALTTTWWLVLFLLLPFGLRVIGRATGMVRNVDPVV